MLLGAYMLTVPKPNLPSSLAQTASGLPKAGYASAHSSCRRAAKRPVPSCFPVADRSKPCNSSFFFLSFFSLVPLLPSRLQTLSLQYCKLRDVHDGRQPLLDLG